MIRNEQRQAPQPVAARMSGRVLAVVPAAWASKLHTFGAALGFGSALVLALSLHYQRVVKNEYHGHPDEWWPSVSATIGDWYPERQVFQICMALTAAPRLALVGLFYLVSRRPHSRLPSLIGLVGVLRTVCCATWMFVTSSDGSAVHDTTMISYMALTIPWMAGCISLTPPHRPRSKRLRRIVALVFFGSIPPLVYLYISHKVHRIAGAYSRYAYFEWTLIVADVAFDAITALDFSSIEVRIVDVGADDRGRKDAGGGVRAAQAYLAAPPLSDEPSGTLGFGEPPDWQHSLEFLSDSYLSLCFWTTLTAFAPSLFYHAVWAMGLAGSEAFLLLSLSPVILVGPFRRLATRFPGVLHLLGLVGMACFAISTDTLTKGRAARMKLTALGVGVQTLAHAAEWDAVRDHPQMAQRKALSFVVGLLGTVVLKQANFSLNPLWPFMTSKTGGMNGIGIVLGVLAASEAMVRSPLPPSPAPKGPASPRGSALLASLGLGATFFAMHTFMSDAGTIIAWSWTGWPIKGPTASTHSPLTVLAISLGLILPHHAESMPSSRKWLCVGAIGCAMLYSRSDWQSFAGGCVFVAWLSSQVPLQLRSALRHRSATTLAGAWLCYNILVLLHVFTTAYAFVPGGRIFRERTDAVLTLTMILLGAGIINARSLPLLPYDRVYERTYALLRIAVATLSVLSVGAAWHRRLGAPIVPFRPQHERILTAGIWTVHFCLDGGMVESQRRITDLLRDAELDVVGLLETDLQHIITGNRDLVQYAAHTLGYYTDMGPTQKHTWGAALLSKYPIVNSTHHLLPSPNGELAPAIYATLDVLGHYVDVVVAHNGQEEDALDRELQSRELARLMAASYPRPTILLAYLITRPHWQDPAPYEILIRDGKMLDVDWHDLDRWCEYILFRGLRRLGYARITRGSNPSITDTELQVAKFYIPMPLTTLDPSFDVTQYRRIPEHEVPPERRFSDKFKGEGTRGHRFHVLGSDGNSALYYSEVVQHPPGQGHSAGREERAQEQPEEDCKVQ